MIPADLAPGDSKSLECDWTNLVLHQIRTPDAPSFATAFGELWRQFGTIGELEQPDVLARRMLWDPAQVVDRCAFLYQMMVLTRARKIAAVLDHTAIILVDEPGVVVHLSHHLVAPEWRRTGLAGWLRALPVQAARAVLSAQKRSADSPITLVAEMEHPVASDPATHVRLAAYEKAGYKKIDPARVHFLQPDFRSHREIDSSGGPRPIPLGLVIRRVGREGEDRMSGAEVLRVVRSLYKMYGAGFRKQNMEAVQASLETYPAPDESVLLIPPSA